MKVFLDTNVLVSGFATRGLCADVIRAVLAEQQLLTAPIILQELKKVLTQKIRLPKEAVQEILAFLNDYSLKPNPHPSRLCYSRTKRTGGSSLPPLGRKRTYS